MSEKAESVRLQLMDLQNYLADLSATDQLSRVGGRVDCDLEVAALCRREFQKPFGGRGLFFPQLVGSEFALAANLFGSEARLGRMLRCDDLSHFAELIHNLLRQSKSFRQQTLPAAVSKEPIVELKQTQLLINTSPDITKLPGIRSWPGETGRYLNLALTVTRHPGTAKLNVGLYRAQLLSATQIALNFAPGSGAAKHLSAAIGMNKPLPVALVLGSDPAYLWAAAAPIPANCNEFAFCAEAFGSDSRFIACVSQGLTVPADAEVIIEGQINPGQICCEGPFGNHTGQYVSRSDCPLLEVTAVLQKPEPIVPMTVVGPPPSENVFLGKANEILIREMLKLEHPQITKLQMPVETIFHGASLLSVRAQSHKDNRELIDQLWNHSPLRRAKFILLLDEDIDLASFAQCWWRCINKFAASRIYQSAGRIAIDATGVDPATLVVENQATINLLKQRSSEYNLP